MGALFLLLGLLLIPTTLPAQPGVGINYHQTYRGFGDENRRGQGGSVYLSAGAGIGGEVGTNLINAREWDLYALGGFEPIRVAGFFLRAQGGTDVLKERFTPTRLTPVAAFTLGNRFVLKGEGSAIEVGVKFLMYPNFERGSNFPRWTLAIAFGWGKLMGEE